MKERIYRFLEIQDSSKSPFQFLFKGKRNIHFPFGMILSFIINIICICLSVTLILELINHSKPTVNYAKFHTSMTQNITLNTKTLLFTIAIRDQYYNLINDPSIGSIKATYEITSTINGEFNINIINLQLMNCSNVFPLFKELGVSDRFESIGLINYNCYNFSEPIIIGGKYGTDFYANLYFYITKCRNSSDSNIICKSEDEINSLINNGWLQITYVSSYVDFNNFTHPIQYITDDSYINLDINMNKQMYIYFSPLEIYSEKDIIFSNKIVQTSTKHDYTITDIISVLDDGIISSIMVCPSFNIDKYYRRYIKIQEIGASIGGFYSVLNIFSIIISSYAKFRFTEMTVVNELFAFGSEKVIKDKKSFFKPQTISNLSSHFEKVDKKKKNRILPFQKKHFTNEKNYILNIPVIHINDSKFQKMNYYKIDLGIVNSFKLMLCFWNNKIEENKKEYQFVMKELLKYIDYIQVSKFFMDVEKIKTIMKSNNICDNWISEKKLIPIILGKEEENDTFHMAMNSTVLANSNVLIKDNKNNDLMHLFHK